MKKTSAVLLALLLGASACTASADSPFSETVPRRFETVFFISLPFCSLYSGVFMLGVSAITQKGNARFTVPYQATTLGIALFTSGWIAWNDHKKGGPDLSEVENKVVPEAEPPPTK